MRRIVLVAVALLLPGCLGPAPAPSHPCADGAPCAFAWTILGGHARYPYPVDEAAAARALVAAGFEPTATTPWGVTLENVRVRDAVEPGWREFAHWTVFDTPGRWENGTWVFAPTAWGLAFWLARPAEDLRWVETLPALLEEADAERPRFDAFLADFERATGFVRLEAPVFEVLDAETRRTELRVEEIRVRK